MKEKRSFMDDNTFFTEYDRQMQTKELQILKTMLPYADNTKKQQIYMLIMIMQYRQFQKQISNTPQLAAMENSKRPSIWEALRPYCSEKERETLDNLQNLLSIIDGYDSILH